MKTIFRCTQTTRQNSQFVSIVWPKKQRENFLTVSYFEKCIDFKTFLLNLAVKW